MPIWDGTYSRHAFRESLTGDCGGPPTTVSIREGSPFRLQKYMALRRFISITSAMRFTNKPSPSFLDRFHDVRQMLNKFNEHYL